MTVIAKDFIWRHTPRTIELEFSEVDQIIQQMENTSYRTYNHNSILLKINRTHQVVGTSGDKIVINFMFKVSENKVEYVPTLKIDEGQLMDYSICSDGEHNATFFELEQKFLELAKIEGFEIKTPERFIDISDCDFYGSTSASFFPYMSVSEIENIINKLLTKMPQTTLA